MKTRKQWFEAAKELGLPWADQALTNLQTYHDIPAETHGFAFSDEPNCKSLSGAIESAFVWHSTPEGHEFWEQICKRCISFETIQNLSR